MRSMLVVVLMLLLDDDLTDGPVDATLPWLVGGGVNGPDVDHPCGPPVDVPAITGLGHPRPAIHLVGLALVGAARSGAVLGGLSVLLVLLDDVQVGGGC